jgi:hypothetical protein
VLTPIQLTPTESLLQTFIQYPGTVTDATALPTGSASIGVHAICEGALHLTPVSPAVAVVSCWKCAFRIDVPSGLVTYGDLRAATPVNSTPLTGVATLDGTGTAVVPNVYVTAATRFVLSVQQGTGVIPLGTVYQASRVVSTSFTIKSTAGAADVGVQIYYQFWEPTVL